MSCPLISILVPNYNSENYIEDTLLSCINQSYKNIEIIIVDDGSTDDSINIIKNMKNKYSNISLYKQKNKGAPAARNLAFQKSKGEFIQYLDADDLLHKDKLQKQIERIKKEPSSIIFGNCKFFYNEIEKSFDYTSNVLETYENPEKFLLDLWSDASSVFIHCWLISKELVEKVNGWDEKILKNQDGVFFAQVAKKSKKVIFEKDSLVYCRLDNTNSISRKKSPKSEESALKSYEKYEKLFKNDLNNPKVKYALSVVYSIFIFRNYPENKNLCKKAQKKIESFGYKKPINVNNKLYKILEPYIGIYAAIWFHKFASNLKQKLTRK